MYNVCSYLHMHLCSDIITHSHAVIYDTVYNHKIFNKPCSKSFLYKPTYICSYTTVITHL